MEIGLGIDGRLVLSDTEQADIAAEAALLGYTSLWTPNRDGHPFALCAAWHAASGLETGISVAPLERWTVEQLVAGWQMAIDRTGGHFVLGVGAGRERDAPIRKMRELAIALRGAIPAAPIYLGALGPRMLHLAGERYDGRGAQLVLAAADALESRAGRGGRACGRAGPARHLHPSVHPGLRRSRRGQCTARAREDGPRLCDEPSRR